MAAVGLPYAFRISKKTSREVSSQFFDHSDEWYCLFPVTRGGPKRQFPIEEISRNSKAYPCEAGGGL